MNSLVSRNLRMTVTESFSERYCSGFSTQETLKNAVTASSDCSKPAMTSRDGKRISIFASRRPSYVLRLPYLPAGVSHGFTTHELRGTARAVNPYETHPTNLLKSVTHVPGLKCYLCGGLHNRL